MTSTLVVGASLRIPAAAIGVPVGDGPVAGRVLLDQRGAGASVPHV
ncbi:hypothetical protein [Streptomyces osmaniensis]